MRTKMIGAALAVAALGGLAIAGESDGIPEKVRALAAKLFKGDVKLTRVAVYEVKGRDASGREAALLVTEDGTPLRPVLATAQAPAPRAFLGVRFASAEEPTVAGTIEGTAAAKAGLKNGDKIVQVGEKSIDSAAQLMEALAGCQPGQKVKLVIERDGWKKTIDVTLGVRPAKLDDDGDDDEGDDDHDERSEQHEKSSLKKHDERGEHHGKGEKDDDDDR